jgi:hypothetical protein
MADAPGLGPGGGNTVGVQVPPPALEIPQVGTHHCYAQSPIVYGGMGMGRVLRVVLAVAIALIGLVLYPVAHAADMVAEYGQWTMSGKTGTVVIPGDRFPAGDVTTNAVRVAVPSGKSSYLNDSTPFGQEFGSSRDRNYLQFGSISSSQPSRTTITFRTLTPASDWGFALGDIDAEKVKIIATGADGSDLSTEELGFRDAFNYCQSSPRPSSCGSGPFTDKPVWDTSNDTLTGNGPDTEGASGWFMPTKPVKSLTLVYSVLTGIPSAQLWLAAKWQKEEPIKLDITDGDSLEKPGDTDEFHVEIENPGPHPEPPVTIRDDLSEVIDDAQYLDDAHADGGVLKYEKPDLIWEGRIPPDTTREIEYSVRIDDPVRGNGLIRNVLIGGDRTTCRTGKEAGCSVTVHVAVTYPCRAVLSGAVARNDC